MNMIEEARKLRAVAFALNKVEVKGRDNMDALLGSIQTVEQVAGNLERHQEIKPEPEVSIEAIPDEEIPAE